MKKCKCCGETKPLDQFYDMPSGKLGKSAKCKPCYIEHYKQRYQNNAESLRAYQREYGKEYRQRNRGAMNAKKTKHRASRLNATPHWLTKAQLEQIKDIYKGAKEMEGVFPWKQEVDHIIPLRGKEVCGLHVPWNLQILCAFKNSSKGNKLIEV